MKHLLAALLLLPAFAALAQEEVQSGTRDDGGIRLEWRYTPRGDGADAGVGLLDLRVMDAAAGTPLRDGSGRLAAWLQRRRGALSDAELTCTDRVRLLTSQGLGRRADIDLNTYRLLTLNTDGTLVVINPFVGLNNAKLESIVELGGTPTGWLHIPERMEVWVTLAEPARLVAVDLQARRVSRAIDLPEGGGPPGLAWEGAAGRLWVGVPGHAGLGVLRPDRMESEFQILTGPPPLALWSDPEGNLPGLVSLDREGVSLHDAAGAAPRRWQVAGTPVLARYSALALRLVVAGEEGGLTLIDPRAPAGEAALRIALDHPVRAMALLDGGRRALAIGGGRASLVDLATATVALRLATVAEAAEIVLTDRFAYAFSPRTGSATLWSLADLRQGRVQPGEVTLGSPDPAAAPGAARGVAAPAGNGVMVASPADGMVFEYREGMMAPIDSLTPGGGRAPAGGVTLVGPYSNYRRAPLGLALLDLAPREVAPGHYRSPLRHEQGGTYDLVVLGASPRFSACARLRLAPVPGTEAARRDPQLRVELAGVEAGAAGQTVRVRLRQRGEAAGGEPVAGVPDLVLLVFDRRSGWQARAPLSEMAQGEYQARIRVPAAARYELLAASVSRNLSFVDGRMAPWRLETEP